MIRNTLILPEGDAALAARLLQEAIDDLHVVTMLVFGRDRRSERIVRWADQLCEKTRIAERFNLRRVVWIRKPGVKPLRAILDPLLGAGSTPAVAVLDFHDRVRAVLENAGEIDPLALEKAFLEGHAG